MALETKLTSPDGVTTIPFKDERVTMQVSRDLTARPIAGNNTVALDLRKASRTFTVAGKVTVEGASSALAQVESLESAALTWAGQTGANSPPNSSKFVWGKKSGGADKTYYVYIKSLTVSNTPADTGGAGTVFEYSLLLQEVSSPLSTSG